MKMNKKNSIILSIILALISIGLGWCHYSDQAPLDVPSHVVIFPAVFWCVTVLPPILEKASKKKNDGEKDETSKS